jgi:iron(III) transport system ATP-binding protein
MAEVKINSVTKLFGDVKAVDDFSIVIRDGEFVSILGPSGCGKTTMLRMIAGFERADAGEIYIGSDLVSSAVRKLFIPPEKRKIGMVFQSYAVWPHMSVFDNVAYPLKIKQLSKRDIKEKTNTVLEMVHLGGYSQRLPSQLSGGQQQRVALARALVAEPDLLLLDEPLSNLDAKLRESMRFELKELQKKLNVTVIYVTHDQSEAMAMSDRIVVMNSGRIQQIGFPMEIYDTPVNRIIAEFIGLVNIIDAHVRQGQVTIPDLGLNLPAQQDFEGKAVVEIRPEHITLSRDQTANIQGIIIHKFYLGDSIDWRIQVNDIVVRVIDRSSSFKEYTIGDKVGLQIQNILLFPA